MKKTTTTVVTATAEKATTMIKKKWERVSDKTEEHWDDFCDWLEGPDQPKAVSWLSRVFLHKLTVEAPVVILYCLLCVLVFALQQVVPGLTTALAVEDRFNWYQFKQIPSLVTHIFAHSSIPHLKGNLVHILLVGPSAEHVYGSGAMLLVLLLVAVSSAAAHILIGSSYTHQLGASGVVFAFILLNSLVAAAVGEIPLSFVLTATLWGVDELYKLFFVHDGVSHHAHLTGAIVGSAFAFYWRRSQLNAAVANQKKQRQSQHWTTAFLHQVTKMKQR
jgi:membrane associated rhomboid family serine protease